MQENEKADTERVPIVLAGATCEGTEDRLSNCPNFSLGRRRIPNTCSHEIDVYLVCSNGPDPGVMIMKANMHAL